MHHLRIENQSQRSADAVPTEKVAVTFEQLRGIKQLRHVAKLLARLHEAGCDRDKADNRELHFDDYVMLILLYLFNPTIESIALLQGVAELPGFQKRLGVRRFSAGSFSESCRVFEPAMLQDVVDQLAKGLLPIERDELLKQLPGKLTLVDSSVLRTLCTVAEAIFLPLGKGRHSHAWRLHLQFDVDHHVPHVWDVTVPKNTGASDEKSVLRRRLESGHTYVMDRWYAQFTLWNDIKAAQSSYVCRVRDNSVYEVIEDRPLNQEAIDAGVISDQIVHIGVGMTKGDAPLFRKILHAFNFFCFGCGYAIRFPAWIRPGSHGKEVRPNTLRPGRCIAGGIIVVNLSRIAASAKSQFASVLAVISAQHQRGRIDLNNRPGISSPVFSKARLWPAA